MISRRVAVVMVSIALGLLVRGPIMVAGQEGTASPANCPLTSVEDNIALVQSLYTAVQTADATAIDEILADNFTHNSDRFGLPDDPTTNDDEVVLAQMLQQVYPNSEDAVREIFGAGDKVVVESTRVITEHTFTGQVTKLDKPFEFRTIAVLTIECGQVVNMNATANTLELLVALGVISLPATGQATPTS